MTNAEPKQPTPVREHEAEDQSKPHCGDSIAQCGDVACSTTKTKRSEHHGDQSRS